MWVDSDARGFGLAGALVARVTSWAAEQRCRAVRLHHTDGNARAESLYRRLGFARTGRTEVRDRDGLVEVEMEANVHTPRGSLCRVLCGCLAPVYRRRP